MDAPILGRIDVCLDFKNHRIIPVLTWLSLNFPDFAFCHPGTPPRVLKSSIDFSELEEHRGDADPQPFSFLNDSVWIKVGVAAGVAAAE